MNEKSHDSIISEDNSEVISQIDAVAATDNCNPPDDEPLATRSTYESFYWLLYYIKMFTTRLTKDVFVSLLGYYYGVRVFLPNHIVDLMRVQQILRAERESHNMLTFSSSREQTRANSLRLSMRKFFKAFKSYILSSEDDEAIHLTPTTKAYELAAGIDREPIFVIVDSSCSSNPSSKELLIENKNYKTDVLFRRCLNKKVTPVDVPSTSKDFQPYVIHPQLKASDSVDELQMIDINLQSENEILLDEEVDNESIVISYLKNRDAFMDTEGTPLSTKKKSSLLESVPKMETILESEQFSSFPIITSSKMSSQEDAILNEDNKMQSNN